MNSGDGEVAELIELGAWLEEISESAWRTGSQISGVVNLLNGPQWLTIASLVSWGTTLVWGWLIRYGILMGICMWHVSASAIEVSFSVACPKWLGSFNKHSTTAPRPQSSIYFNKELNYLFKQHGLF